ncbi:MAG: hypothetical protein AAF298_09635 [Cyanobacteria bacterium P01_A01_bin.40]
MYLKQKKSFSHELVLPTLKDLLKNIKLIADDFYKPDEDNNINIEELSKNLGRKVHHIKPEDVVLLPLNSIFNAKAKRIVKQIAEDFIIGNKLSNKASVDFVYQELITILGHKIFYLLDSIEIEKSISLFANPKEPVIKDISSTKLFAIPVVGISLKKKEKCKVGCIEFVNNLDFINQEKGIDFEKRVWTALYWFGETMI